VDSGGWQHADLSAITGAPGADRDALGFFNATPHAYYTPLYDAARVVYRGNDAHIHELWLTPGSGGWQYADLSALSGAWDAWGEPFGYFTHSDSTARVIYRGSDDHIHELWLQQAGGWNHADLAALTSAPPAIGDSGAYVTPLTGPGAVAARVLYRGRDNHIHELGLQPGGAWTHRNLFGGFIRVHFKVLVTPSISVNAHFTALRDLFGSVGILVERGSDEDLTASDPRLDDLRDIEVGDCLFFPWPFSSTTAEQERLFDFRANVGPNDLVVYFVRMTTPGTLLGCATHPGGHPGAVVARSAPTHTVAHELGHVLGLGHVDNTDRLMNPNVGWTNLPPDVIESEVGAMDGSSLTRE
jgi:hypothetical protein